MTKETKQFQLRGWPLVICFVMPWFVGIIFLVKATVEAIIR